MGHELAKIKDLFRKLNFMLTRQQKQYGVIVFLCTIISAVLETLGVSVVLPVVEGLMDVESLRNKWYVQPFVEMFRITRPQVFVYIVCGEVVLVYLLKNIYFIFYTWIVKKYTYKVKRELGMRVMKSYLMRGYIFFVNNNSGKLMQGVNGDVAAVNTVISIIFNILTKVLMTAAIGVFIVIQEPFISLLLLVLAVFCVAFIQLAFKGSMSKYGALNRRASQDNVQACIEIIHGSKEILVTKKQDYFKQRYEDSLVRLNNSTIKIEMATTIPAYLIEMICIIGLILAVAIEVGVRGISGALIGSLSVIAVSAFRILPAVGTITSQLNSFRSSMPAFNAAYRSVLEISRLEEEIQNRNQKSVAIQTQQKIKFKDRIELKNVYYKYPNTENYVLRNINFTIKPKTSIGLIGSSGAGKSTLVDVLLGLLVPEQGTIEMDGIDIRILDEKWNHNVGYVPQSVYLVDGDIRSNIAFGIPKDEIDDEQLWKVLEMAQLAEFVRGLPNQLDTIVGERGVKFSGGQRQRVAIARALYENPSILVLDEATAALDNDTEKALMEAIDMLQGEKTLIIVAHRLTTIRNCDLIYEIRDGQMFAKSKEEIFGMQS